jgi:hypothetical protein
MKSLPPSDQRFLDAAEGWPGLRDPVAANGELEQITPTFSAHPLVLEVRCKIYAEEKHLTKLTVELFGLVGMALFNSSGFGHAMPR